MADAGLLSRRGFLAGSVAAAAALAGCGGGDDSGTGPEDVEPRPVPTDSTPPSTPARTTRAGSAGTPTTPRGTVTDGVRTTGTLDLREANVVGVDIEQRSDGVRFDVTLYHDDEGEDGYADWWQVEAFSGASLGRRDLTHPHGTTPFTRSLTVDIPDSVICVVVRGHDQTHGYGGQAMVVNVEIDTSRVVDQGAEPETFAPGDCP